MQVKLAQIDSICVCDKNRYNVCDCSTQFSFEKASNQAIVCNMSHWRYFQWNVCRCLFFFLSSFFGMFNHKLFLLCWLKDKPEFAHLLNSRIDFMVLCASCPMLCVCASCPMLCVCALCSMLCVCALCSMLCIFNVVPLCVN